MISPTNPDTDDVLTATSNVIDAQGEVSIDYEWFVDGNVVQIGPDNTLDGAVYFDKNQQITVNATPNDDSGRGTSARDSVTCVNTAPEAPTIEINPGVPTGLMMSSVPSPPSPLILTMTPLLIVFMDG